MAHFMDEQRNARPNVAHAVAYVAPLWTLGLLVLIPVLLLTDIQNILSFEFSVLAVAIVVLATITAFHAMVHDLRRESALRNATYRRMMFYRDVIAGLHTRALRTVAVSPESPYKHRRPPHHR